MDVADELLELAVTRKDALAALADGPRHRRELQDELEVSKTTSHRILRSFDDHDLLRRTESGYELTLYGRVLAEQTTKFDASVSTTTRVQPLLELFESSDLPAAYDVFVDPDVDWSVEEEAASIDRGIDRLEDLDVLRVLDWTPIPDLYQEKSLRTLAESETRSESIYPKAEVTHRLERFRDLHDALLEAGARARYWVYDDVPEWGLSIYDDDLVELRAYDRQSSGYILEATSDDPTAVDWALDIYSTYRDRATPLTDIDDLPDWGDYSW